MYCALFLIAYVTIMEINAEEYIAPDSRIITMTGQRYEWVPVWFARYCLCIVLKVMSPSVGIPVSYRIMHTMSALHTSADNVCG
jgi:hypothetical protein